jgi:glutathione S-transferase
MRLIGMLDSPYVRRVAISLEYLRIPFVQESVSVFRNFEKFQSINPVVKAPTLVCDDNEILMDSSLILQFIDATRSKGISLWSDNPRTMQHEMRAVSLALAACEKNVQIIYERNLRPESAQYEPWLERVSGQLQAAYEALEKDVVQRKTVFQKAACQASITSAVAWRFTQMTVATLVPAEKYPGLGDLSARMEKTAEFAKYPPDGAGVGVKKA